MLFRCRSPGPGDLGTVKPAPEVVEHQLLAAASVLSNRFACMWRTDHQTWYQLGPQQGELATLGGRLGRRHQRRAPGQQDEPACREQDRPNETPGDARDKEPLDYESTSARRESFQRIWPGSSSRYHAK